MFTKALSGDYASLFTMVKKCCKASLFRISPCHSEKQCAKRTLVLVVSKWNHFKLEMVVVPIENKPVSHSGVLPNFAWEHWKVSRVHTLSNVYRPHRMTVAGTGTMWYCSYCFSNSPVIWLELLSLLHLECCNPRSSITCLTGSCNHACTFLTSTVHSCVVSY